MASQEPAPYLIQLGRTAGVDDPFDASYVAESFFVSSVNPITQIGKGDRRAGRIIAGLQEARDDIQVTFWPFSWDASNSQSEAKYRKLMFFLRSEYLYIVACNFPRYVAYWQALTAFTSDEVTDYDIYSLSALSGAAVRVKCEEKSEKINQVKQIRTVTATLVVADPIQ